MLHHIYIFLYSIVFSFIISIPIGGVNVAVFQATLNDSRRSGYLIGFGAISAEAIYCAVPMFGLTPFLESLGVMKYLYFLFIPILLFMGVYTIVKASRPEKTDAETDVKAHRRSAFGYFVYGFLLCISNPMTFIFWIQTVVFLRAEGIVDSSWNQILAWFMGVPVGVWLLYFGFVQLASITRRRMSEVWKARMNIIVGVIFIVMAVYISYGAIMGKGEGDSPATTEQQDSTSVSGE